MHDAKAGMQRHGFRRGCLIGNLSQEIDTLPDSFNGQLLAIMREWEQRVATCLLDSFAPIPPPGRSGCARRLRVISGSDGKGRCCMPA
ncbi:TetR family transcriptional regulator C-terminal domain-containing protein [Komagataeibacter rhaeticus]|nr:TetR family transcriptional regulator C-terminal domain-containing protein [Komagataeibacter rhaeticus]